MCARARVRACVHSRACVCNGCWRGGGRRVVGPLFHGCHN